MERTTPEETWKEAMTLIATQQREGHQVWATVNKHLKMTQAWISCFSDKMTSFEQAKNGKKWTHSVKRNGFP